MGFVGGRSKSEIIDSFARYVSPAKAKFFSMVGIDFVPARREGVWYWDLDGRRLMDCHCNGGVFNLGHRHPEVVSTLREAVEELDIGNHHLISEQRARLAEKLAEVMPGDISRTVFGVGGGEAIDFAIKLARGHTGKKKIVYARGGYHGHTGFALAAGDEKYKRPFEPLAPGFVEVPFGNAEALERAVDSETAAVLFETIPATLGMPLPPDDFYKRVREICDEKDCLMMVDEVQTGLGRTGRMWGIEHYKVVPDVIITAKGLSGGIYPISATCFKDGLDDFMSENPFIHVSTFGGAEIGCAVALKVLEITSNESFMNNVRKMASLLSNELEKMKEEFDFLEEIRQKGLFIGIKMVEEGFGPLLSISCYHNGILAVYANNDTSVMQFLPPLIISQEHTDYISENLRNALEMTSQRRDMVEMIRAML
ncbi:MULTISPECIES: aspartate aminotransferase family protein [unclassified Archaeoglobus]|jgi:acetylornithine/succinyldiaminopimelate/putrescine aminotransferase|uniref:aspartate aminotransferase family protein n=1 Tax=unclassified Archaeoglobus TaxID=2643606 RepID=UPI0025B7B945|nr:MULTISPECIES: aspartate aminotransferase family protein [unclassified Archaeoglobus]